MEASRSLVPTVFPELTMVCKCAEMLLEGALMVMRRFHLGRRNRCFLLGDHRPETGSVMQEGNSQTVRVDGVGHKINESGAGFEGSVCS